MEGGHIVPTNLHWSGVLLALVIAMLVLASLAFALAILAVWRGSITLGIH